MHKDTEDLLATTFLSDLPPDELSEAIDYNKKLLEEI